MTKAVIAVLILAALLTLSVLNAHKIDKLTGEITQIVEQSRQSMREDDFESALKIARHAYDTWTNSENYTHITIRHPEIDSTTDSFCMLLGDLYAEDAGSAEGAYEQVIVHLTGISEMEKISLGSIF